MDDATQTQDPIETARRSLARAYAEGTHARFERIDGCGPYQTGHYRNRDGVRYVVRVSPSGACCSCPAGRTGLTCKHQVACADIAGLLDVLIPGVYAEGSPALPAHDAAWAAEFRRRADAAPLIARYPGVCARTGRAFGRGARIVESDGFGPNRWALA